ncbi:DUF2254 family protein [Methanolobus halotolerans]|uniref:DUF2254 domain-containing protein n=1 Tax=Methanolobus halotolerans TaxID=2052935 RepID=A0A4E0PW06_9EURY|nr:DUF2254 family protein [Methanolobus halotolerans]TGC09444.1 hypothetical protein CUN85_06340 [Methanolobus halotolerans]
MSELKMAKDINDGTFKSTFTKVYFLPFIFFCFVSVVLAHFNIGSSDLTSAQYLISALVQGEAAILAIIISVTIFAVSTSQTYSPRIVDIFLDKDRVPHFWSLLTIYIFALIYGTFVLKFLKAENAYDPSNLQTSVWIACFLGLIAIMSLIKYIPNILTTLKPSNIMETLSNEIEINDVFDQSIEHCLTRSIEYDYPLPKNSVVRPILDIISSSIVNNNNEIASNGIDAIEKKVRQIIKYQQLEAEQSSELLQMFREKYFNIGHFCIERNNFEVLAQVVKSMVFLEATLFEVQQKTEIVKQLVAKFENLAITSIEKDNEFMLIQILESITTLGTMIYPFDNNDDVSINVIDSIKSIRTYAANANKYVLDTKAIVTLGIFGCNLLRIKYKAHIAEKLRVTLEYFGTHAFRTRNGMAGFHSVERMLIIMQLLSDMQKDVSDYNDSLDKIIKIAIDNRFYPQVVEISKIIPNYPAATVKLKAELREDGRSYLINDVIHF